MRVGPSKPVYRHRLQTTSSRVGKEPNVVSVEEKASRRRCQVRIKESSASEPLMMCRKRRDDVKTGGKSLNREESGRNLITAQMASGMKAARL
jgi:hypothetical protein